MYPDTYNNYYFGDFHLFDFEMLQVIGLPIKHLRLTKYVSIEHWFSTSLHIRITWGAFEKLQCLGPSPRDFD